MPTEETKTIISVYPPHIFVRCEPSIERLLGYSPADLVGNADGLRILCFERTDSLNFISACVTDFSNTNDVYHMVLRTLDGRERRIRIKFIHDQSMTAVVSVRFMTMAPSQAILLNDALSNNTFPQAIVSANYPHIICTVNSLYAATFSQPGYVFIAGRPLLSICAANSNIGDWASLLLTAADGRAVEGVVNAKSFSCPSLHFRLRCAPVAASDNERLSFLLAVFLPLQTTSLSDAKNLDTCSQHPPSTMLSSPLSLGDARLLCSAGDRVPTDARGPGPPTPAAAGSSPRRQLGRPRQGDGPATVVLVGVSTNLGMPGNMMTACDLGYTVVIPEDCIAGATGPRTT